VLEPRVLVRLIATGRVLLGLSLLVAPRRLVSSVLVGDGPSDETLLVLRMLAARDAALGLGGMLADRHGSAAVRGWSEAGAFSDAVDAAAFAASSAVRRPVQRLSVVLAASAALTGAWASRRLA
jgi:hypothetical protein